MRRCRDQKKKRKNVPKRKKIDLSKKVSLSNLDIKSLISDSLTDNKTSELYNYLKNPAPNIIEWVTSPEFWNVASTWEYYRQYEILRDLFNLRCTICNPQDPASKSCWDKPRSYLESETLLVWNNEYEDFVCPKCGTTMKEFVHDGVVIPYKEMITIAGMRSGKSYLGAHIGGYFEHMNCVWALRGKNHLQHLLKQEKAEWFEVTFAASTATQAQYTIYAKYREMRNNSPWINKYITYIKEQEEQQVGTGHDKWAYKVNDDCIYDGWAQVRYNRVASDSAGIAGKTRIFASIDEWARLQNTEGTRSAQELYRVLNQSLMTVRGSVKMNDLPFWLGLMINVTSPISVDDPAMERYNMAKAGEVKNIYSWKGPTWHFNPKLPRELFDDEYDKDPVAAERDFGANPPLAATPFIDDPVRFWKSIEWDHEPIATFSTPHISDSTGKEYIGAILDDCKLDTYNNHYIFFDAGLNWDAFSIVCAHPEYLSSYEQGVVQEAPEDSSARIKPFAGSVFNPEVFRHESEFGDYLDNTLGGGDADIIKRQAREYRKSMALANPTAATGDTYEGQGHSLVTVYDFCMRIVPPQGKDIWFESVINIIEALRVKIKIAAVVADHWQSEHLMQKIRDMNIQSYKHVLKPEHFMQFLLSCNNGKVKLLPPDPSDNLQLLDDGTLVLGQQQEYMSGPGVGLVECLKLSRTPDLKKFVNENKGKVRGRDSDDTARCIVGAHWLVNNSVVDEMADNKKRRAMLKKQMSTDHNTFGGVY